MNDKEHWQDWGTALIGAWVFVSPWFLGAKISGTLITDPHAAAVWNFWCVGMVLMGMGLSELSLFTRWKEWFVALVGTWLFLSPRILDFAEVDRMVWNAAICGLAVVALAGWAIGDTHEILPRISRRKGDLRGDMIGLSLPDEHEHMAGQHAHRTDAGPGVLTPGIGGGSPGQATKSS